MVKIIVTTVAVFLVVMSFVEISREAEARATRPYYTTGDSIYAPPGVVEYMTTRGDHCLIAHKKDAVAVWCEP